jgi:hypothetical protein
MLHKSTTWGSLIYLGYGGAEPALIATVLLEQRENGKNTFIGAFMGLGGPDKSQYYAESPMSWSKYTHASVLFPVGKDGGFARHADIDDPRTRQDSYSGWHKGKTLQELVSGKLGPGVGLGWYRGTFIGVDVGDVPASVTESLLKVVKRSLGRAGLALLGSLELTVKEYPAILVADQMGYTANTFGPIPANYGDWGPPKSAYDD